MRQLVLTLLTVFAVTCAKAQTEQEIKEIRDSLYIEEVENKITPDCTKPSKITLI